MLVRESAHRTLVGQATAKAVLAGYGYCVSTAGGRTDGGWAEVLDTPSSSPPQYLVAIAAFRGGTMNRLISRLQIWALVLGGLLVASPGLAITVSGPFGALGSGGATNGQTIGVGSGAEVFETTGFLNVAGLDLNGGAQGTSAQFDVDPLPAGLSVSFSSMLQDSGTDLILSWQVTNNTSAAADASFLHFLDAEIDEPINTFFNETASVVGALAAGQGFEADEPGFQFGDIYDNLLNGSLDGTNIFGSPEDVSLALSFDLGTLAVGGSALIDVMISEDGDFLGGFALEQQDADPASTTVVTYSGVAVTRAPPGPVIPEPSAALVFAVGVLVIGRTLLKRS